MSSTKIWGHRGASGYAPENTIEAFDKAITLGADGVELDIQLSHDGELVVIHDETIDRVSDGKGNVRDYTLRELKALDVSGVMPSYGTVRIPTLGEVLEELRPTDLEINIECKTGIYFYPGLEEKMINLVKSMGMVERIWCSSFNHKSVLKVKKLCPEMRTGFLIADVLAGAAHYTKEHGAQALHPALYHMQDDKLIEKCHKKGLEVHVWTVNEGKDVSQLAKAGADAVITNYPDVALAAIADMERKKQA